MKKKSFEDMARLETADLLAYGGSQAEFRVPMRFGDQKTGTVGVTRLSSKSLAFTWQANGKGEHSTQVVGLHEFFANGALHLCLKCPDCKRLKKSLYLVPKESTLFCTLSNPFSLVCSGCVSEDFLGKEFRPVRSRPSAPNGGEAGGAQRPKWWVEPAAKGNSPKPPGSS